VSTEYRVAAVLDPSGVSAGGAKVKQELRGIDTAANSTKQAINKAFDQTQFDRSIGSLVSRIDTLDTTLKGLNSTSAQVNASNATVTRSLDVVAGALDRVAKGGKGAGDGLGNGPKGAGGGARELDAALRRVLEATDAEALALQRMNQLLADAKRLLDAGKISQEQFAKVQKLGADAANGVTSATGAQRMGMQQLGYQLGDVATMYSLGAKPAQIFGSQIGQITQAVQLMSGGTSKFATFLGGPWGIALSVGTILLAPFVGKLLEGNDALGDAIQKLRDDARETELNRKAKEAYNRTVEGQIALQRKLNDELDRSILTQRQMNQQTLRSAQTNLANQQVSRGDLVKQIADQQRAVEAARASAAANAGQGTGGLAGNVSAQQLGNEVSKLKALQGQLTTLDQSIANSSRAVNEAQAPLIQQDVAASLDKRADAALRYEKALGRLNQQLAIGAGRRGNIQEMQADGSFQRRTINGLSPEQYSAELRRITKERDDAIEAAAKEKRDANRRTSDGVSRFRSRQQAIGIAGRELQRDGLRVGENEQFGGVSGGHKMASHGKYAIDVNAPGGVTEANVPDLRKRFDELARRYQARGYRVLWNGWVYEANSEGPTRRIPGGQHQHYDHMHVEAPGSIVGKATQASTESQAQREENSAAKVADQQGDFVQNIVDQAATRGVAGGAAQQLTAQIEKAKDDFKRRFNTDMTDGQLQSVTKALTDAEARETANRFDEAYNRPLQRLKDLQGKVGLDRQVLNAQLDESIRQGRALTPEENAAIDRGIRQGDALQRQQAVLESIRQPQQDYASRIAALNALLAEGQISQNGYNAEVAKLGQGARDSIRDLPGRDAGTGETYGNLADRSDEDARYAQELSAYETNRDQLLQLGISYNGLVEAAARRHADNLRKIDNARRDVALGAAQSTADSLLGIAEDSVGRQSAIYKGMFVVSKAFAIADAIIKIQQGVANAIALPFPANLGAVATVAAQAASIVSNIQAVSLNLADGGRVLGPGGARDDKVPANLSNGEYVINSESTAKNLPLIEAINNNTLSAHTRRASNDNGAGAVAARGSRVSVQQFPGTDIETREDLTSGDVWVIARRVARQEAGPAAARDLGNPNSRLSKSMGRNTLAGRRRS
jgi:hypothetical protein